MQQCILRRPQNAFCRMHWCDEPVVIAVFFTFEKTNRIEEFLVCYKYLDKCFVIFECLCIWSLRIINPKSTVWNHKNFNVSALISNEIIQVTWLGLRKEDQWFPQCLFSAGLAIHHLIVSLFSKT